LRLDGKVAWVTGASRGLGRATAFALAGAGAEVLLMARSESALIEVAAKIQETGGNAHVVRGSIAEAADVAQAVQRIEEHWGRLDVLVNNAGISPTFKRSELIEDHELKEVLDTNLLGAFACCRAALPLMELAGGGSIVNVSSVHANSALERLLAYSASKSAIEALTRTLAIEWAPRGIRVNSLAPGYLETEMTAGLRNHAHWTQTLLERIPMGRFASPSELVASVLFLAGPASSYMTGTTLLVDGGWSAR
jgi:NAD(P)-dependent dehydrogenase (short-subunit alcohol dehydrogenase family)